MKGYSALANWDGSLTNGTSSARDARDAWHDEAQATLDGQNGALNVNGLRIPRQDTRNHYPSETGRANGHGGATSRMNGIQPVDASLKAHRVVNGYTTYKRNDGPSSAHIKSKQSLSSNAGGGRLGPVPNGATNSLSQIFVPETPSRARVVWPGKSFNPRITQYGLKSGDEQLGMDMDDISSLSSLDADGEDDEDASFVDTLLMNPEPSSKTPTAILSDDPEPSSPLSPLFTPSPSAEMHINTSENVSRGSPSIQHTSVDPSTPPSDINPVASSSQVEDLRSFTIVAKGSKQGAAAITDSRGKKRKRMMFSHIAVPPLPDSVSRKSYRSISSLPLETSSTLMSRPAKVLAEMKVKKTLVDGLKAIKQRGLDLMIDDQRDATYKPSIASKRKSLKPSKIFLRETTTASEGASVRTATTSIATPKTAIDTKIINVHTTIPPINASPLTQTLTPQPSFPISRHSPNRTQSSVGSPGTGEKRKYQKRAKGGEVDSVNPKPKKTPVARIDKANEAAAEVIQHPKEQPKKHRRQASSHSRYNAELDILQIFFHGIPTMRHSVLEMNVRHIRSEKCASEDDGNRYTNLPQGTTQGRESSSSWFIWPPPRLDWDEEDQYYMGGMLEKIVDKEEVRLELSGGNKAQGEHCSLSHAIVSDERLPTRDKREVDPLPSLRSPTTVPNHLHAGHVEDESTDQFSPRPSAKALGKRKAKSPSHFGPKSPPVTPRRSTDGLLMESDGENVWHMEQYLQDLGPTPQSSGGVVDSIPNLLIASTHRLSPPLHHNGYDSDTLSRALISVDNDPFIFSASGTATNIVDPFLAFNSEDATINSWPGTSSLTGGVYKGVYKETVAVNDTIDPLLLRGPELVGSADSADAPGIYQQQAHPIYAPPHGLSTPTAHDLPRPLLSPTIDDMSFRHPSPSLSLPLSASVGRRPSKIRRPSDMVDITHLDLGPSMELSDREMDEDYTNDPVYVPNQAVERKGPRIVSAKELARIQKRKALEREKERERERLKNEKASALNGVPIGHPRSKFACGTEHTFCHQCRRRTYYLKMKCICRKLYCNRCISTRYNNLSFNESKPDWTCPACREFCTCDQCTKKRGEVYVSLRPPRVRDETAEQVITRAKTIKAEKVHVRHVSSSEPEYGEGNDGRAGWMGSSADEAEFPPPGAKNGAVIHVPNPFPPTRIVGVPGSHWGNVYSLTGEKVGTACVGEGNKSVTFTCTLPAVIVAPAVAPLRKRVFVGRMQPCWGKDMMKNGKIRVLDDEDAGTVKRLSRQENVDKRRRVVFRERCYIGDPEVLLKRVVSKRRKEDGGSTSGATSEAAQAERAEFAYSLSPLSSLSSLPSNSEDEGGQTKDKDRNTLHGGRQLVLGPESQFDKVEVKAAQPKTKKQEASQDKGAGVNDIVSSLGKQDGVPQPENKAVKDGYKVEMKERTKAQGKEKEHYEGERGSAASFSPDSLGDNDVARAILLSFSACSMPVNA